MDAVVSFCPMGAKVSPRKCLCVLDNKNECRLSRDHWGFDRVRGNTLSMGVKDSRVGRKK